MPPRLALLFALLLLSGLLLTAGAAHGAAIEAETALSALDEPFEAEAEEEGEEESAEEECAEAEEGFEEGEISAAEAKEACAEAAAREKKKTTGSSSIAPKECVLRSAHAHAALRARDTKLKLTIGYTTYEPITAKLEVGHGSGHIATLQRHLGRSGVIRIVEGLHSDNAPQQLTVGIQLPSVKSAGCPFRRLVLFPR